MAKWYHPDILDYGLDRVRERIAVPNTVKLHILKAYAAADSYATALANSVGSVALAATDLSLGDQGSNGRQVTVATKNITASAGSGATPDIHIAILDETDSKVLVVTDETGNAEITTGQVWQAPAWAFKQNQPT